MSKNVTISEGSQSKNFNGIKKLRTNLIGGGNQYWVPEDECGKYINTKQLTVDTNGTYLASNYNCDAFSQVSANAKPNSMEKSVNINGSYNASDDNVQAYSSVEVNVVNGDDTEIGDYYYPVTYEEEDSEWKLEGSIVGRGAIAFNGNYWLFEKMPQYNNQISLAQWDEDNKRWYRSLGFPNGKDAVGAALFSLGEGMDGNLYQDAIVVSISTSSYRLYNEVWSYRRPMPGDTVKDWMQEPNLPGIGNGSGTFIKGNELHMYAYTNTSSGGLVHARMNIDTKISIDIGDPPPEEGPLMASYNGEIYGLCPSGNFYKYEGPYNWILLNKFPVSSVGVAFVEHKKKLHAFVGEYHYSFNGRWWRKEESIGEGGVLAAWASVKNENVIHILKSRTSGYEHLLATYTE